MGAALEHRGPDDVQFYDDGHLSLVSLRLSIVDIDHGRQPIYNEAKDALIAINGEIYNHEALRRELKDKHRFSTHCDSEVPLHVVEEYGVAGLNRLNGMYALAVWNIREKKLLLARDPIGIKPLYICRLPHGLLFASEMKALLAHPDCPREMDWTALYRGPQTRSPIASYMKGIDFLPGGHYLEASSEGALHEGTFWNIDGHLGTAPYGQNARAYSSRYRELLEEATISHLIGEVPMALYLSGGVDSSLLAAIAARNGHRLPCFTVVERTTYRAGDVKAAQNVAKSLGMPWYPVLFDYRTFLDEIDFGLERFEQSVWMMDSPRFDPEWIFKEELHRLARTQIPGLKVTLLGQGADEFAGGYSRRIDRLNANWAQYIDEEIMEDLRQQRGWEQRIPPEIHSMLTLPFDFSGHRGPYHEKMRQLTHQLKHYNLWHEDRTSSSQSMEARVPFLDHRLVELLASIPRELHEKLFWNKKIVRQTLAHYLPKFDQERPKVGFYVTDDPRSINLLVHQMATRVAKAFRQKYLNAPHFPLDRDRVNHLIDHVLARGEFFIPSSWQLMECMAICIFERQIRLAEPNDFKAVRQQTSRLQLIDASRWDVVEQAFAKEPGLAIEPPAAIEPTLPETSAGQPDRGHKQVVLLSADTSKKHQRASLLGKFKWHDDIVAWFDCSDIEAFAIEFTNKVVKRLPPNIANANDSKSFDKVLKTVGSVLPELQAFVARNPLNFYKKARLANLIRWRLRQAGYAPEFTDSLSRDLAITIARRR